MHLDFDLCAGCSRAIAADGTVQVTALKTLLHRIADSLPRTSLH